MTVGSLRTMPAPLAYTRVLAVPRSMARSLARARTSGGGPLVRAGMVVSARTVVRARRRRAGGGAAPGLLGRRRAGSRAAPGLLGRLGREGVQLPLEGPH